MDYKKILVTVPNLGIELRSPALQVDSLLSEPPGEPHLKLSVKIITILDFYISAKTITWKNNSEPNINEDLFYRSKQLLHRL